MARSLYLSFFLSSLLLAKSLPTQEALDSPQSSTQKDLTSPLTPLPAAYKFAYGFDFDALFDNLEDSFPYWDTRTLMGVSLFPEVGLDFEGQHLRVGGFFTLYMGREDHPSDHGLSLWYDFFAQGFSGYFGIFPKSKRIGKYPLMFFRRDYDLHPSPHQGTHVSAPKRWWRCRI